MANNTFSKTEALPRLYVPNMCWGRRLGSGKRKLNSIILVDSYNIQVYLTLRDAKVGLTK